MKFNPPIDVADARAMVAQFAWSATPAQQEAIVLHMVATGCSAMHAAWALYGQPKGLPCQCTPCLTEPQIGSELVVRILVSGPEASAP